MELFKGKKYISRGVNESVDFRIIGTLYQLVEDLRNKKVNIDYLQIFEVVTNKDLITITHSQEEPEYQCKKSYRLIVDKKFNGKLYLISDIDENSNEYSTLILPEEY